MFMLVAGPVDNDYTNPFRARHVKDDDTCLGGHTRGPVPLDHGRVRPYYDTFLVRIPERGAVSRCYRRKPRVCVQFFWGPGNVVDGGYGLC